MSRQKTAEYIGVVGLVFVLALWPVISFSLSLMLVFLWLAFVLVVVSLILKSEKIYFPDKFSLYLLCFFLCGILISMFVSDYQRQSFRGLAKIVRQLSILFLALYFFKAAAAQFKLKWFVMASFALLCADGAYQYLFGTDFLRGFAAQDASSGVRLSASFEHYGKLAAYLCAVLPVVIGYALAAYKKDWRRWEFWVWLLLSVAGLILFFKTRSRGAFIALFLGFVILLFFRRSWKSLSVLTFVALIFVSMLPKSMVIHLDAENKEQSVVERLELWHRAWDVIQARPLTGTGINTYAVAHQKYDTRKNWRVQNYYAHNGYLQMAAEIGVPGALALILFFLRWLWICRPTRGDLTSEAEIQWGLWGGSLAFMIFCLGDTAMHSSQPVMAFWFVMGLLGAFAFAKPKMGRSDGN